MTKPHPNIYFDFEFVDDGEAIIPISLGMCTELTDALAEVPGQAHEF